MPSSPSHVKPCRSQAIGDPAIRMEGVSLRYGDGDPVLRDFDLRVAPGEALALLGPSGCGKSTILRLMAGLLAPDSGSILVHGRPPEQEAGGGIGFVFQSATLSPWATVLDNVALPRRLLGASRAAARAEALALLDDLGLSSWARAYPAALSGGMAMRVSIARALTTRPRALLMDEPFAALDEITRFKLDEMVLGLWDAWKPTIVFVTHSVYEAAYVADRIAVMGMGGGGIAEEFVLPDRSVRGSDYRSHPDYASACRRVGERLADLG